MTTISGITSGLRPGGIKSGMSGLFVIGYVFVFGVFFFFLVSKVRVRDEYSKCDFKS